MPFACSRETVTRESRPLSSPALNTLYGPPLLNAALALVRRRLPNLPVQLVADPSDLRHGWVDADGITQNVAHGVRADTPLHELSHVVQAIVRTQKGEQLREWQTLLRQLSGTPQHLALASTYPLSPGYSLTDQLEEVAHHLIGQAAARRLRYNEGGIVGRLHGFVENVLRSLFGLRGYERGLSMSVAQTVDRMARALVDSNEPVHFDGNLEHLLQVARDQRVDVPVNTAELLSRVSGQGAGSSLDQLLKKSEPWVEQFLNGATSLSLPGLLGSNITENVAGMDEEAVRDLVVEHFRQYEQSSRSAARAAAMQVLDLPAKDLVDVFHGKYDALVDSPDMSLGQQIALASELSRVFTDVQPGDTITPYGPNVAGLPDGLYDAALDNGSIVVHLKPRNDAQGNPITEVTLVSMDSDRLTEASDDKPLLNELYSGSWKKAAQGWAAKRLGVKLTGSARNRQLLETTLLAAHLNKQGLKVTGVGVAKLDLTSTPESQRNDARLVPITEYLDTWKALGKDPGVAALLPASVKALVNDADALSYKNYEQDYPTVLARYIEGKTEYRKLAIALGDFEASERKGSVRELVTGIEKRLEELYRSYEDNTPGYLANPEVALLGETLTQLQGVSKLLNRHKDIGQFEQWFRSFNAGDNPHIQWFYEQWRVAREMVTSAFLGYQNERMRVTKALREDYTRNEGMISKLRHEEHLYYRDLLHRRDVEYKKADGTTASMEVNEYRFKMPGTPEFEALRPAQKEYITFMLGSMKELLKARYTQKNKFGGGEFEDWYKKTWGHGYLPLVPGSTSRALGAGEWDDQALEKMEGMLAENYLYDRQDNANMDTLSDKFGNQGGKGPHGSEDRLRMLGLMPITKIDSATGKRSTEYVLDPDGGRRRQLLIEPDLMKSLDQFHMSYLKNLMMNQLHVKKLTAVAMIRAGFRDSGLLRGRKPDSDKNIPGENTSRTEENLNTMYQMLVLSRRDNLQSGPGMKRASLMFSTLGAIASFGGLGFSVKTAVTSTTANFFAGIGVGITNWGKSNGLSIETMGKAMKALCTDRGKLWAVAKHLRTLEMDEFALLESKWMNGTSAADRTLSDIPGEAFIIDKMGNIALTLWLTASQMMQDGTWDVYNFNKDTGELTYNEAEHRKLKGDVHVDAIRRRLELTGELEVGAPMTRGHDDRMRGSIEAWNAEVLGAYKDEVDTTLGANVLVRSLRKMRTFAVGKINRLTKDRTFNVNQGYRDNETGEWVSREEVGLIQSVFALAGGVHHHRLDFKGNWNSLSEADRYNLKKLNTNSLIAAAAMVAAGAAFGDDDDDEKAERASKVGLDMMFDADRKRKGLTEHALNSVIQETFLFYELSDNVRMIQTPFISVVMAGRLGTAFVDYLSGDFDEGNRILVRNLGPLKTATWLAGLVPDNK